VPVFGGIARVNVGGTVYLFDKLFATLYLYKKLPVDSSVCTYFDGLWMCGSTLIPAGVAGRQGVYYSVIPLIDTKLNYSLASVPSSEITVVAVHNTNYDPSRYSISISSGYLYAFIWENLDRDEAFYITCYSSTSPYPTSAMYIQGPAVFFAYRDQISGYDNGGSGSCDYVYAEVVTRHDQSHAPSLLRISNTSYIKSINIALFSYGRGILPGAKKNFLTAMVDITSVSL
jgi:hypothetical protein